MFSQALENRKSFLELMKYLHKHLSTILKSLQCMQGFLYPRNYRSVQLYSYCIELLIFNEMLLIFQCGIIGLCGTIVSIEKWYLVQYSLRSGT